MIISRKKFENEMEKVRSAEWERQRKEREDENLWKAIYILQERVDKLEGKEKNKKTCRPSVL